MERAHAIYPRPDMLKQNRKKAGAVPAGRKEPSKETLAALRLGGNRVVVVGLLGGSLHGKARLLGILADSALPQAFDLDDKTSGSGHSEEGHCRIEMYHSAEQNVVYLNLVSIHDSDVFADLVEGLDPNMNHSDFHLLLAKKEYHHLKAMLFMFHVCHFMLVVNHGMTFNLKYLRLFRTLQTVKQMMGPAMTSFLETCAHLPEFKQASAYTPGRCVPALSFVFNMNVVPPFLREDAQRDRDSTQDLSQRSVAEKMRYSLEAQVRYLIRRSRVLPSSESSVQLFTLDSQRLVHMIRAPEEDPFEHFDPLAGFLSDTSSASPQLDFPWLHHNVYRQDVLKLRELLLGQAKATKAQAASKRIELASSSDFYVGCLTLQQFFLYPTKRGGHKARTTAVVHDKLKSFLDPEYKFSQSRCMQALPAAKETYVRDLPQCYPSSVHEKQLDKALRYFYQNARGPAVETFIARLKEECTKFWENGRRLCDALSLTGRPCTYRIHTVPADGAVSSTTPAAEASVSSLPPPLAKGNTERRRRRPQPQPRARGGVGAVHPSRDDRRRRGAQRRDTVEDKDYEEEEGVEEVRPRDRDRLRSRSRDDDDIDDDDDGGNDDDDDEERHDDDDDDNNAEEGEREGDVDAEPCYDDDEANYEERCIPHSSAHRALHACNCGRSRRIREDPFDAKEANYDFFLMDCCREAILFEFPLARSIGGPDPDFSFSFPSFPSWSLCRVGPASLYRREAGLPFEGFVQGFNHLSFMNVPCHYYPIPNTAHMLGQQQQQPSATSATTGATSAAAAPAAAVGGRGQHRAAPLPDSAAGFATLFAAISDEVGAITSTLSASGAKAETSVGTALELAVMHRRQKFLESKGHALHVAASNLGLAVPTSTAIAPAAASALPAAARATSPPRSPMRRRERQRRKGDRDAAYDGDYERDAAIDFPPPANKIERPQATFVSVLLGFEYECPAGHRFLALPSKAHKQDRHYRMKNKGDQRVRLNSDVPLYAPCTGASCCQKVAPALAQLQRLYFVTPNQPESILLRPRIQWSPAQPTQQQATAKAGGAAAAASTSPTGPKHSFETGLEIALPPNSFLCLRLPYVYTLDAEGKRPLLQTGPNEPFQCCLIRDFLYVAVPQAYSPS